MSAAEDRCELPKGLMIRVVLGGLWCIYPAVTEQIGPPRFFEATYIDHPSPGRYRSIPLLHMLDPFFAIIALTGCLCYSYT